MQSEFERRNEARAEMERLAKYVADAHNLATTVWSSKDERTDRLKYLVDVYARTTEESQRFMYELLDELASETYATDSTT